MHKYNVVLFTFLLCLLCLWCCTYGYEITKKCDKSTKEFDVVIFTQRWPPTVCYEWKEDSESHSCSLPKQDTWTIHGIWPTKFGCIGPEFCNRSLSFDPSALAPMESELKENWIDIRNGSNPYSFWKHEWDKHGTCAVILEDLDSEFKYFETGLKLLDTYSMIDVLAKANILPGSQYMIDTYLHAVEKVLSKRAQVMCTKNEETGESYVFEIRICFDKTLQLMDCDGISGFPTDCTKSKPITYPGHVPHNYYQVIRT